MIGRADDVHPDPLVGTAGTMRTAAAPGKYRGNIAGKRRASARLRLTILYGVFFLVAGVVLVSVNYVLVRRELTEGDPADVELFFEAVDVPSSFVDDLENAGRRFFPDGLPLSDAIEELETEIRDEALAQLLVQSGVALFLTSLVSVTAAWFVAGRVLRPVHRIAETAQHLSDTTLDERIRLEGPDDELKMLADAFDAMLDRLQRAFESQHRFSADVSHELRTPLSIIKGQAELALADPTASAREQTRALSIRAAVDRSERLIGSLLTLARSGSSMLSVERVDLAELAGDVVSSFFAQADEAGVRLDLSLGSAFTAGDPSLLAQMIANLVDNALRYNAPENGWLHVCVESKDGMCRCVVRNAGLVVSGEEVNGVFQAFHRLSSARAQADENPEESDFAKVTASAETTCAQKSYSYFPLDRMGSDTGRSDNQFGHGLGGAIVRSVAEAHGGSVTAFPREGGGLIVEVLLPSWESSCSAVRRKRLGSLR